MEDTTIVEIAAAGLSHVAQQVLKDLDGTGHLAVSDARDRPMMTFGAGRDFLDSYSMDEAFLGRLVVSGLLQTAGALGGRTEWLLTDAGRRTARVLREKDKRTAPAAAITIPLELQPFTVPSLVFPVKQAGNKPFSMGIDFKDIPDEALIALCDRFKADVLAKAAAERAAAAWPIHRGVVIHEADAGYAPASRD